MVSLKEQFQEALKKSKVSGVKRDELGERDTGFFRVRKIYCQSCKQKFTFRYKWFDLEEDKYRMMSSVSLMQLRRKVIDSGLPWEVDNIRLARETAKKVKVPLVDLKGEEDG